MKEQIEFGKWYEKDGLAVMFEIDRHNTNAYVQGGLDEITDFVVELDKAYNPNERQPSYEMNRIRNTLQEVLDGDNRKTDSDLFCFSDDRVRSAQRLDNEFMVFEGGPYDGSPEHIQIRHNEQYGGKYPCSDLLNSSRANLIDKVLTAIGDLTEEVVEDIVKEVMPEEVAEDIQVVESKGLLARVLSYLKPESTK